MVTDLRSPLLPVQTMSQNLKKDKAVALEVQARQPAWRSCDSKVAFSNQNVFGEEEHPEASLQTMRRDVCSAAIFVSFHILCQN